MASTAGITDRTPRYLELAARLRADILAGKYSASDGFPTEAALCEAHGVSRFTVREALRKLQAEGLIQRRQGSGTVIQPAAARAGALHQPLSNVQEILQYARDTHVVFTPRGWAMLPKRYAEQIGLEPGSRWFHFSGLRAKISDGQPIALTDAYVHQDLAPVVERIEGAQTTIFQQLEAQAGIRIARVTQDIQAVPASSAVAEQLGIARRSPCLRIIRCYIDDGGRVFEISVSHHPGERFAYAMHIEAES